MKANISLFYLALLASFVLLVSPALAAPSQRAQAPSFGWVEEVFVDYSHAGPGPHPSTESDNFHLTQGGIKWPTGATIKYTVSSSGCSNDCAGAVSEVDSAFDAWELGVITYTRDDGSPDTNPCTGLPNSVSWSSIDGSGGALAVASVCRNVATKVIGGFRILYDTAETWSDSGDAGKFDIRNVGAHEAGHVSGLDHTNAPQDGCLTMYRFAGPGETQKQTLGLGDKLGMQFLYGSTDVTPGSCGS